MSTDFSVVRDDFEEELTVIESLVQLPPASGSSVSPKIRVAAANSATLLLAATFEEYVRQMARTYARQRVSVANTIRDVPPKMLDRVWRSTMKDLARLNLKDRTIPIEKSISDAKKEFDALYRFCSGDLVQDIYDRVIHNEGIMKPNEINEVFGRCGLEDVIRSVSAGSEVSELLSEDDVQRVHSELRNRMEEFFGRRNEIAHSIGTLRSSSPEQIVEDIAVFRAFARSLCEVLEGENRGFQRRREGQANA